MNKEKRDIRVVFMILTGIFGLLAYKNYPSLFSFVLIAAGISLLGFLTFAPLTLRPAFSVWLKIAHVIGKINTRILLFIIFVFIFIPVGLLVRLFGSDPMQRKVQTNDTKSYWEPYQIAGIKDKSRYERQF